MRPCWKNRKAIALMAANVLDERQEQPLQAHLKTCADCRHYLAEISRLTEELVSSNITANVEASNDFHQRIVRSIRTEQGHSSTDQQVTIKSWFAVCLAMRFKRAVVAGVVSLGIVIALFIMTLSQRHPITPGTSLQTHSQLPSSPQHATAPSPTLSNYRKAVNGSPEKLDELLALQCRGHSQAMPIMTASIR